MAKLGSSVVNGKLETDELQVIAASGTLAVNIKGNTKIDGDLEVNGDVTYIGEKDLRIQDKTIEVGYLETGSITSSSLDGAGIYAGNIGAAEAFPLIKYDHANEKIVFGKPIAATISGSIDHAEAAGKVDHALTIKGDGVASTVVFDGSEAKEVNLDLSAYEKVADFNAYTASQAAINANLLASASAAETSAKAYTDTEIQKLDAIVTNTASAAGGEDSTQILVTINEQDGKLTSVDVNAPAFQTAAQAATDLQSAKDYADAQDVILHTTVADEIATAKSEAIEAAAEDATTKANAAEANAKSYVNTVSGSLKTYADNAAASALADAKTYTETVSGSLKTYADNSAEAARANAVASASADATSKASAAQAAAEEYADEKIEALDAEFAAADGYYVTGLTQVNGKITAVASASISIPDVPEYTMVKAENPDSGSAATYYLTKDGEEIGARIQIAKDQFLKSADFYKDAASVPEGKKDAPDGFQYPGIRFEFWTGESKSSVVWVSVKDLVDVYTAGNGIVINNNVVSVKVKTDDYIRVDATNGLYTDGIDDAIETAVAAEAEIARAAESANSASIAAMDTAYKAADTVLSGSIATEIERAKAAELALTNALATESAARISADEELSGSIASAASAAAEAIEALDSRVDDLEAASHSHDNKTVLDGITANKVSGWDTAATQSHVHSNKAVLDGISETKVANWDRAYADVNASSGSWNAAASWVAANKTAVEQAVSDVNDNKANWNAAYTQSTANSASIVTIQAKDSEQDGRLDTLEAATASYMNVNGENSNITKDLTFADGAGIIRYSNDEFEFVFGD